jgi:arsenate reductase (thioredoxin)
MIVGTRMMKTVLFICTHNSARSQMAEGIANAMFKDSLRAYSAGTEPTSVHLVAVEVLKEIGVDISGHRSKGLDEFEGRTFDAVVTVCNKAHEACPFFPGAKRQLHHSFEDPSGPVERPGEVIARFRKVRDEIKTWIGEELIILVNKKEVVPEPLRF